MKIYIDCQVLQTLAFHRGMGKYSLELLRGIAHEYNKKDMHILLSSNLGISEELLDYLHDIGIEYTTVDFCPPIHDVEKAYDINKQKLDELKLEDSDRDQVIYVILSLFLDNLFPVFPSSKLILKGLLVYDLIPLQFPGSYLDPNPAQKHNYLSQYRTLYDADVFLTISETVRDDLVSTIGIPQDRVVSINGATIKRADIHSQRPIGLDQKVKRFILMPTGDDVRKNNPFAIKAFETFREQHDEELHLVVTSFFSDMTQQFLSKLSEYTHFVGNVSEAEMAWLYDNAELLLFPSIYEGLGLPLLEAVDHNLKVVCSNIPVFREISQDAFFFFELDNQKSCVDAMLAASRQNIMSLRKEYKNVRTKYTWKKSAVTYIKALTSFNPIRVSSRPKIALFSPNPEGYSAIGKVVEQQHYLLNQQFDVTYFFDSGISGGSAVRISPLPYAANSEAIGSANKFTLRGKAPIYHIGNSEYHAKIITKSLIYPGIAVLHDTNLSGLYSVLKHFQYISDVRFAAEETLDKSYLTSLCTNQNAIIVHSDYAKEKVKRLPMMSEVRVEKGNLPVSTVDQPHLVNKKYICVAGGSGPAKNFEALIELKKLLHETSFEYMCVGRLSSDNQKLFEQHDIQCFNDVSDLEFVRLLSDNCFLLNYREIYMGETSLTVLEAMALGVIPIVNGSLGWYAELPDNCVLKVPSIKEAAQYIISKNDEEIRQMSINCIQYVKTQHDVQSYIKKMKELYDEALY